jgi:hypothetical protein
VPAKKKSTTWLLNLDGIPRSIQFATLGKDRFQIEMAWSWPSTTNTGRLEPVSVLITSPEGDVLIPVEVVRRLPIGRLQQQARRDAGRDADHIRPRLIEVVNERPVDPAHRGGHRGRPTDRAELEAIARTYLAAWGNGEPVTAAVAEKFHISKSTSAKRIMAARKAGLLDQVRRITK